MEITVNEELQLFHLAFDEWKPAFGHGIKVGEHQFCAIPLSKSINISEATSGMKVFDIELDEMVLALTETKEETVNYFEGVGQRLGRIIKSEVNKFEEQLSEARTEAIGRLGEMPLIEKVNID